MVAAEGAAACRSSSRWAVADSVVVEDSAAVDSAAGAEDLADSVVAVDSVVVAPVGVGRMLSS